MGFKKIFKKAEMLSRSEREKKRKGYKKDLAVKVVSQELDDQEEVKVVGQELDDQEVEEDLDKPL
ncbi:MAG: hypothetical protein F3740_06705 [Nitrospinae bacterium]|nr:hypothetical protein [Nitrospinota bacterium]